MREAWVFGHGGLNGVTAIFVFHRLFPVFQGYPPPLPPCDVHCIACLAMLSSYLFDVFPSQIQFLHSILARMVSFLPQYFTGYSVRPVFIYHNFMMLRMRLISYANTLAISPTVEFRAGIAGSTVDVGQLVMKWEPNSSFD